MHRALFFLVGLATTAAGAPLQRDLGEHLLYHRVTELPGDLPATDPARKQPLVLDLRYVKPDQAAAIATHGWLKFYATPHTPVFVLANPETGVDLRDVLVSLRHTPGILVVGRAGRSFEPDVPISVSAENDRRAYDALAAGTPIAALLNDNPDKIRNDEASLSRDRLADASADAAANGSKARDGRPPIDSALQRAVHLHRALVALRKL